MYHWIVFLHVLGAFIFALSHGASTKVIFKIQREKSPERLAALLDLSADYINVLYVSLLVMVLAGIASGFLGKWWGEGWIWLGLALFLGISTAMFFMATMPLARLRQTIGPRHAGDAEPHPDEPFPSLEALAAIKPLAIAVIGYAGLTLIIWLMVFKPF
jgi:uncharacterized membrane protein